MNYASTIETESRAIPGVTYRIRRVSFGRRLELARTLSDRLEAIARLALTEDSPARAAQTALIAAEMDAVHLRWGLDAIEGLTIDGAPATADSLIEAGPEELLAEILAAVRHETGLDEEERKNSEPPSTSCAGEEPDRAMRGSAASAVATVSTANGIAGASSPNSISPATAGSSGDGGILKANLSQSS
jgi:hypothetical protein